MKISKKIMGIIGGICMFLGGVYLIYGFIGGQVGYGILLGVIFGVPAFVLLYLYNKKTEPKEDSITELLKMRYVNGEITKEEFEEKKHELTKEDE